MKEVNLMKGIKIYTEKEFDGLSPDQRERHYETVIRKMLENYGEGLTTR